jgi:hypothetical protein
MHELDRNLAHQQLVVGVQHDAHATHAQGAGDAVVLRDPRACERRDKLPRALGTTGPWQRKPCLAVQGARPRKPKLEPQRPRAVGIASGTVGFSVVGHTDLW